MDKLPMTDTDIVNRLHAIMCSNIGCSDLRISMTAKLAADEIERLRAERDEARREVCELRCSPPERFIGLPHELAKVNGWDCFDNYVEPNTSNDSDSKF